MTYRRGIQVIERDADARVERCIRRIERQALRDKVDALQSRNARLERELARARRALAAERLARDLRTAEHHREMSAAKFAIETLCKRAFQEDTCRT
jgi:phage-related minor tail protein